MLAWREVLFWGYFEACATHYIWGVTWIQATTGSVSKENRYDGNTAYFVYKSVWCEREGRWGYPMPGIALIHAVF